MDFNSSAFFSTIFLWLYFALLVFVRLIIPIVAFWALMKYLRESKEKKKDVKIKHSLGDILKTQRTQCQMTQEFVAESLGVSRQAVSKWENGTSDPSTTNLLKLAKLYGISPEELIRSVSFEED